jgi:hypothetical protein
MHASIAYRLHQSRFETAWRDTENAITLVCACQYASAAAYTRDHAEAAEEFVRDFPKRASLAEQLDFCRLVTS